MSDNKERQKVIRLLEIIDQLSDIQNELLKLSDKNHLYKISTLIGESALDLFSYTEEYISSLYKKELTHRFKKDLEKYNQNGVLYKKLFEQIKNE